MERLSSRSACRVDHVIASCPFHIGEMVCALMTPDEFRRMALSFPDVVEGAHMGHADFRVAGKVFATLGYPSNRFAVVMLSPQDQDLIIRVHPKTFAPVSGGWGASGSTTITLRGASKRAVAHALEAAWRKRAPKKVAAALDRRDQVS